MSIIAAGTTTTTALTQTGNTDGTIQLQVNGTTPSVTLNALGAVGVGSTPGYGTSGQSLISSGSTSAPSWGTPSAATSATTATNLAGGSAGTVPYQSASGTTAMLSAGTSGQVLTSSGAGAPTWATPAAGGSWVYISTVNAATSATIDITSGFSSTYDLYMIQITNMTNSANAAFWAQMYFDGTIDTGNVYSYNYGAMDTGGYVTSGYTSTTGDSRMYMAALGYAGSISAPRTINATFYVANPSSTSVYKYLWGQGTAANASGGYRSYNFFTTSAGVRTTAMTGVRFYMQTGNIVTGAFRLYGLKTS